MNMLNQLFGSGAGQSQAESEESTQTKPGNDMGGWNPFGSEQGGMEAPGQGTDWRPAPLQPMVPGPQPQRETVDAKPKRRGLLSLLRPSAPAKQKTPMTGHPATRQQGQGQRRPFPPKPGPFPQRMPQRPQMGAMYGQPLPPNRRGQHPQGPLPPGWPNGPARMPARQPNIQLQQRYSQQRNPQRQQGPWF